jgi:hypothetical protein
MDANYGYDDYWEDQDAYNYYFRQGFERGYEDATTTAISTEHTITESTASWAWCCHRF